MPGHRRSVWVPGALAIALGLTGILPRPAGATRWGPEEPWGESPAPEARSPTAASPLQTEPGDSTASPPSTTSDDPAQAIEALLIESGNQRAVGDPGPMLARIAEAIEQLDDATIRRDPDLRAVLLLELATVHDVSFDRDLDVEHLRQARAALDRLIAETELHGYAASLVDQALAARDRIDDRLLDAESTLPSAEPAELSAAPPPVDHAGSPRSGRGLRITGWTLAGLAAGTGAASIAGLVRGTAATRQLQGATAPTDEPVRVEAFEQGHASNRLALAAGMATAALTVAATTTLVIGYVLRRRARVRRTARVPALPWLLGGGHS